MGCGAWGAVLVDKRTAIDYANRYSQKCSLSREQIYHFAFLAERLLEVNSIDEVVEILIGYEEHQKALEGVSQTEMIGYEGINTLFGGYKQ